MKQKTNPSASTQSLLFSWSWIRGFLLITATLIIILFNLIDRWYNLKNMMPMRAETKHQVLGQHFANFATLTKDIPKLSFFTDLDLSDGTNNAIFSQGQYLLAPTVLDTENMHHEYILLLCRNPQTTIHYIKQHNLQPLRRNRFGLILARRGQQP